jgi:divalent metal cation (Fe/Co/Zn/Cd) transporter
LNPNMDKPQKVALLAIGVNLVLFGLKYVFAEISGSMALKAEAIHSLSDVIASSTVFAGLIIAKRKTRSFPSDFPVMRPEWVLKLRRPV